MRSVRHTNGGHISSRCRSLGINVLHYARVSAGPVALLVVTGLAVLMFTILLPQFRVAHRGAGLEAETSGVAAPLHNTVLQLDPVGVRADAQGRIEARIQFDAGAYNWNQQIEQVVVATGNQGSVANWNNIEAWPDPPDPYTGTAATHWDRARETRSNTAQRLRDGAARAEAGGNTALRDDLNAEADKYDKGLAPDGVCPAVGKVNVPDIVYSSTNALGDRTFLGCRFKPYELVDFKLTFTFTGLLPDAVADEPPVP